MSYACVLSLSGSERVAGVASPHASGQSQAHVSRLVWRIRITLIRSICEALWGRKLRGRPPEPCRAGMGTGNVRTLLAPPPGMLSTLQNNSHCLLHTCTNCFYSRLADVGKHEHVGTSFCILPLGQCRALGKTWQRSSFTTHKLGICCVCDSRDAMLSTWPDTLHPKMHGHSQLAST